MWNRRKSVRDSAGVGARSRASRPIAYMPLVWPFWAVMVESVEISWTISGRYSELSHRCWPRKFEPYPYDYARTHREGEPMAPHSPRCRADPIGGIARALGTLAPRIRRGSCRGQGRVPGGTPLERSSTLEDPSRRGRCYECWDLRQA